MKKKRVLHTGLRTFLKLAVVMVKLLLNVILKSKTRE